jgi:hypothetical protein
MTMMIRAGAIVAGILLLWLAVAWSGWLPRPSAQQRAALAQLQAPNEHATGARNAFGLFWFLHHDVDESEQAALIASDAAVVASSKFGKPMGPLPRDALPRRVPADLAPLKACGRDSRCLADVRAATDDIRAGLAARQPLLDRLEALDEFDHYRNELPATLASPFPALQDTGRLQILRAALRHVDGESDAALAGLCEDLSTWRRLKGRSDSLVFEMVSLAWLRDGAQLFADIRAELPPSHPLPASCGITFGAPGALPRQSCDVYRGEFAFVQQAVGEFAIAGGSGGDSETLLPKNFLLNRDATIATLAPRVAANCELIDRPLAEWTAAETTDTRCRIDEWMFNPAGCVMATTATPNYTAYLRRDHDARGQLRLLALADWLVLQPDPQAAFDERPPEHRAFEKAVAYVDGELSIELLDQQGGRPSHWRIPLPGSRVADGAVVASTAVGEATQQR